MKKLVLLFLVLANTVLAQQAKLQITSVNSIASQPNTFAITGVVSDELTRWAASDFTINDVIYFLSGNEVYEVPITGIVSATSSTISLRVVNTTGGQITTGQAAIVRKSSVKNLPKYVSGLRKDLAAGMGNVLVERVDPNSGTSLPNGTTNGQVLGWNGSAWGPTNPSSGADNWGNQVVTTHVSGYFSGNGTSVSPLNLSFIPFSGAYSALSGIPGTFTPAAHSHIVADVTGLQTALDTKVDKVAGSRLLTTLEANLLAATSGTNTGDETQTTIKTKLGAASSTTDGYLTSANWNTFNNKEPAITRGTVLQYWKGDKTWATLDKTAVGLGNVDNTSDSNKPISTLTQSALNGKQGTITTGTTGQYFRGDLSLATFPTIPTVTPAALTKTDDTNVTLTLGGTPSTALLQPLSLTLGWSGTLADSRIASAATWNAKEPSISSGTTSQYWRGDKTWQTLPTIPSVGSWGALNLPTWTSGTPFVKMTGINTFALDNSTYLTGITSGNVTTALGFTPYNSTNPAGYISSVPAQTFASLTGKPTTLSGYGITDAYPLTGNPSNFLTSITSGNVTTALGFTPYNATNPNNYITLTGISSTATGLTYTNTTGVFSLTSGYEIPTTVALSNKLGKNTVITAATKTKITYDANGLVTAGADATTADISESTNKKYVTDANLTLLGNTSGTNTGDETASTIKTKLGAATASNSGYLTSTDWSTFNNKLSTLTGNETVFTGWDKDVTNEIQTLSESNIGNTKTFSLSKSGGSVSTREVPTASGVANASVLSTDGSGGYAWAGLPSFFEDLSASVSGNTTAFKTGTGNTEIHYKFTGATVNYTAPNGTGIINGSDVRLFDVAIDKELPTTGLSNGMVATWNGSSWTGANPGSGADNWGAQTASVSAPLSGNGLGGTPITLSNSGVTAGTYNNVTVSSKGLVTDATNVSTSYGSLLGIPKSFTPSSHSHNISDVTNLTTLLAGKEPTITTGTTAQYYRGDKAWTTLDKTAVGLPNVDNTSDANKPVSTATQTALNNKQDVITGSESVFAGWDKNPSNEIQTLGESSSGNTKTFTLSNSGGSVSAREVPTASGVTAGYVLASNGGGTYSWQAPSAASGDGWGAASIVLGATNPGLTGNGTVGFPLSIPNGAIDYAKLGTSGASNGYVLTYSGGFWGPAAPSGGGSPTGTAGGVLAGTYPNPTLANGSVGGSALIDNGIQSTKLVSVYSGSSTITNPSSLTINTKGQITGATAGNAVSSGTNWIKVGTTLIGCALVTINGFNSNSPEQNNLSGTLNTPSGISIGSLNVTSVSFNATGNGSILIFSGISGSSGNYSIGVSKKTPSSNAYSSSFTAQLTYPGITTAATANVCYSATTN